MGRYVALSGWAEQKTSRESCCGKTAIHHACQPEFRRAKNCRFALTHLAKKRPGEARPMLASRCAPERSAYAICYRFSHSDDRWSRTNDWQFW